MTGIPNYEARSEWARRHGLDPFMVLADLDVAPAPTKTEPNRVRVTFQRIIRDEHNRIDGREEDTLYTSDAPPPKETPHDLRALELLAAAGMTGADATTSLDTFIERTGRHFHSLTEFMPVEERSRYLTTVFGSDAVRVATIAVAAAEIRDELTKAAVEPADLHEATLGVYRLMRAGRIGHRRALDTTLESLRQNRLTGTTPTTDEEPA